MALSILMETFVSDSRSLMIQMLSMLAMLDHFEIIKLLESVIHHWKGILLRYIMVLVVWLYVN